jgi:hypothetical protein
VRRERDVGQDDSRPGNTGAVLLRINAFHQRRLPASRSVSDHVVMQGRHAAAIAATGFTFHLVQTVPADHEHRLESFVAEDRDDVERDIGEETPDDPADYDVAKSNCCGRDRKGRE